MASAVASSSAQQLTNDDALAYLQCVKDFCQGNNEKYNEFLEVMRDFKSQSIDTYGVIKRVEKLFKGQRELILGFRNFLPEGYEINVPEEKKPVEFEEAYAFVTRIKTRLENDEDTYNSFLDILKMYRMEFKSSREVYIDVSILFEKHEDLFMEFLHFLPANCASTSRRVSPGKTFVRRDKCSMRPPSVEMKRDKDGECDANKSRKRVKSGEDERINHGEREDASRSRKRVKYGEDERINQGEREDANRSRKRAKSGEDERINQGSQDVPREAANHKATPSSNEEEFDIYKPISELDFSNCERCTPSYRHLPKNYRKSAGSNRTELDASVLNDDWVTVSCGREEFSGTNIKKNHHEEILFRCEDDRFEMDILLGSVKAAAEKVEKLLEKMQNKTMEPESPFLIEDHLTSLNLRCIERIYGDHGLEVRDVLKKDASVALPVIFNRLKQKQEEWSKCQADFNKIWARIYAENCHK